tara:strand:- start:199 stop:594 length:396 start_codon:yes stop_codon:yes gene_type:complete
MKNILLIATVLFLFPSPSLGGCGGCQTQEPHPSTKKTSALITSAPKSGEIEGFAIASCGMCNFNYRGSRGCSLTIKVGDKVYTVEGTSMHSHGDPHTPDGMCNAIRVAYVSGKIKNKRFYSDSFTLIESPE